MHALFRKNKFQILDRKKEIACCEKKKLQHLFAYIMIISVKLIAKSKYAFIEKFFQHSLIITHFL